MEEKISYTEAEKMDIEEIMEANAALDYYNELIEKQVNKR